MNIKKIFSLVILIVCFFLVYAEEMDLEAMWRSSALPTGDMLLADNGTIISGEKLKTYSFWNNTLNWSVGATLPNSATWTVTSPRLPVQRSGQDAYEPGTVTISIGTSLEYKALMGKYMPYKVELTGPITFASTDTLYPLVGIKEFNGNGHKLSLVNIKKALFVGPAGLFSSIDDSIYDLTVELVSCTSTSNRVGVLVGYLPSGAKIRNCTVAGYDVNRGTVVGADSVGGLVGYSEGTITGCTVKSINVSGGKHTGGVVGYSKNSAVAIKANNAKYISVRGTGEGVGGIVGASLGGIYGCSVDSSNVFSLGNRVGGILGDASSAGVTVISCSVDSVVVTTEGIRAGGVVAYTANNVDSCSASRVVITALTSNTNNSAGGLVGWSNSIVSNSEVYQARIDGYKHLGGLIGFTAGGSVDSCKVSYAQIRASNISSVESVNSGGLVGFLGNTTMNNDTVRHIYLSGFGQIGGLTGVAGGNITKCKVDSSCIVNTGSNNAGGLVGYLGSDISDCDFDSLYVKSEGSYAGGIVGYIGENRSISGITLKNKELKIEANIYAGTIAGGSNGTISDCHVENLEVSGSACVGGIVGQSDFAVTGCSVRDMQIKASGDRAGGIAGEVRLNGVLKNCSVYNSEIEVSTDNYAGGLVGYFTGLELSEDTVRRTRVHAPFNTAGGITAYMKNSSGRISNCGIDSSTVNCKANGAGVVGYLDSGTVTGCKVDSVGISSSQIHTGSIAGYSNGTISFCTISRMSLNAPEYLGGVVGINVNGGVITDISIDTIVLSANNYVGGIAGGSFGDIDRCSVREGEITASNDYAGGIVGGDLSADCDVANSSVKLSTIKANRYYSGGIKGYAWGNILKSFTDTVDVTATDNYAGGIAGYTMKTITENRVTGGSVTSGGYAGGIASSSRSSNFTFDTVYDVTITSTGARAGGIVGSIIEDNNGKIEDCKVSLSEISGATDGTGGIVGWTYYPISRCYVDATTITSTRGGNIGGIAGIVHNAAGIISNCTVDNARITVGVQQAGGIVGRTNANITQCTVNKTSIKATTSTTPVILAGGIAGYLDNATIDQCFATNDTIIVSNVAGGIAGKCVGVNLYDAVINNSEVSNSYIEATSNSDGSCGGFAAVLEKARINGGGIKYSEVKGLLIIGGLVGNGVQSHIQHAYVDSVTVTALSGIAGGVIGFNNSSNAMVNNCPNIKKVTVTAGTEKAGGIAGANKGTITECIVDNSTILATTHYAGGIVGINDNATGEVTISDVKNSKITANSLYAGGIAGRTFGNIEYCNVYNVKDSSLNYAGGIAGSTNDTISNSSVRYGTITSGNNAGGIVGSAESSFSAFLNLNNVAHTTITSSDAAGGLTAFLGIGLSATNSRVDSSDIVGAHVVGGLVGNNYQATVSDCVADSVRVTASNATNSGIGAVGGIVGDNSTAISKILNCTASKIEVTSNAKNAGGIAGRSSGPIDTCVVNVATIKTSLNNAGGIVGESLGAITKCQLIGANSTVYAGGEKAGGIAAVSSGNITSCTVSDATITTAFLGVGGITGENDGGFTISLCTVSNATIKAEQKGGAGGIAGYNKGIITEGSVTGGSVIGNYTSDGSNGVGGVAGAVNAVGGKISKMIVSGTKVYVTGDNFNNSGCGGIVGSISGGSTIEECAVKSGVYLEGKRFTGGIAGVITADDAAIRNCHVDDATIYSTNENILTYQGGIVGQTASSVQNCLVTNGVIRNYSISQDNIYIGGLLGDVNYTNSATISNNVVMLDHFDLRAKYTKGGPHLGRIAANTGNGTYEDNFGWVETYVKYYHKRFGIHWPRFISGQPYDNKYYGPGFCTPSDKNGGTFYTGDFTDNTFVTGTYYAKNKDFWENSASAALNSTKWSYSKYDSDNSLFPQLAIVSDVSYAKPTNRGNESMVNDIMATSGVGIKGFDESVTIFSPMIFFSSCNFNGYPYMSIAGNMTASVVNLYTDLLFDDDDGNGSSVFWSVDLNREISGNCYVAPFFYGENTTGIVRDFTCNYTFNGNGYSIDGIKYNTAQGGLATAGVFYLNQCGITINRVEISDLVDIVNDGQIANRYISSLCNYRVRGWDRVYLNDIYIKTPNLEISNLSFSPWSQAIPDLNNSANHNDQHSMGAIAGIGNYYTVNRIALYAPRMYGMYSRVGALFGNVEDAQINSCAVYLGTDYRNKFKSFFLNGQESTTSLLIADTIIDDWNVTPSAATNVAYATVDGVGAISTIFDTPRPYIYPNIKELSSDPNNDYYNYGSFEAALDKAGIKGNSNWHIPSPFDADNVYLVRDVYSW